MSAITRIIRLHSEATNRFASYASTDPKTQIDAFDQIQPKKAEQTAYQQSAVTPRLKLYLPATIFNRHLSIILSCRQLAAIVDNYRSIRCEWHFFSAKLWISPLFFGCFCRISSFPHGSYPQSALPMLPNFLLKSAYPGGYIHLDSTLCHEGPNPFQQSFLCSPVDSDVYPHIADPITIIFHRRRSSRNCIRLFHVKRRRLSTWYLTLSHILYTFFPV